MQARLGVRRTAAKCGNATLAFHVPRATMVIGTRVPRNHTRVLCLCIKLCRFKSGIVGRSKIYLIYLIHVLCNIYWLYDKVLNVLEVYVPLVVNVQS